MKILLNPSFLSIDLAWETILNQEGMHSNIIKKISNKNSCIIITDNTSVLFNDIKNYVFSGGTILVSSYKWKRLTKIKTYYNFSKFLTPKENSYFSSLDYIETNHKIVYPKNKLLTPIDKNLFIYKQKLGSGCIVVHPFNLEKIYKNHHSIRKNFYDERKELPSEVVSKTSKSSIRKALFLCMKYLYDFKNYPLIRLNYNPKNYSSVFCFRIDSDFSTKKNAEKINSLCEKYSIPATWFIETSSKKMINNVYKNFKSIEFGYHNDRHIVFNNLNKNKTNIKNGLLKLKQLKINNLNGFAAPFGDWNESLDNAIKNIFSYSSEFGFDYDNFPSYPIIKNKFSKILQLPVHPISIGRLNRSHFTEDEMINYYLRIINMKYLNKEPIILYFHPNNKHFSVIEKIFKKIKILNIKIMTMYDYYSFWTERIQNKPKIQLQNQTVFFNNENYNVEILLKNSSAIVSSKKELLLSNIKFKKIKFFKTPKDIKKIKNKSWRNLLYDFERYNTMSKM